MVLAPVSDLQAASLATLIYSVAVKGHPAQAPCKHQTKHGHACHLQEDQGARPCFASRSPTIILPPAEVSEPRPPKGCLCEGTRSVNHRARLLERSGLPGRLRLPGCETSERKLSAGCSFPAALEMARMSRVRFPSARSRKAMAAMDVAAVSKHRYRYRCVSVSSRA